MDRKHIIERIEEEVAKLTALWEAEAPINNYRLGYMKGLQHALDLIEED